MKQWLETHQVLSQLGALRREGTRAALATVVRVRGSAYRHEGAKLLLAEDGRATGNVSGGCLEEDVREVARRVIASGVAERRVYCGGSNEISAWDLGVGCDGEVEILIEPVQDDRSAERALLDAERPFAVLTSLEQVSRVDLAGEGTRRPGAPGRRVVTGAEAAPFVSDGRSRLIEADGAALFVDVCVPPPRLLVVSAADDARHLARSASDVGFRVVVADRRPGFLQPGRFPLGVRVVETDAARLGERVVLEVADLAVVMTHHFQDDVDYLRALLRSPVQYLGVLGPRQRTERILSRLRSEGPFDEKRIYGPVGLDIGTDGAEQVAVAVIAEILAVRSGRRPRSLRERAAPIHALPE